MPQTPPQPTPRVETDDARGAPTRPKTARGASEKREPPPWRDVPGVTGPADGADPAAASED